MYNKKFCYSNTGAIYVRCLYSLTFSLETYTSAFYVASLTAIVFTPRKIGRMCAAHSPKPLPYLWPKSLPY